jgi:hypothetical protein
MVTRDHGTGECWCGINHTARERLILVGCVGPKLDHAAAARDLYTSPLFRKRRDYAEASGHPWGILSAHYGLVWPARMIEPYDLRIGELPWHKRESLGRGVGCTIRHDSGRHAPPYSTLRDVELQGLTVEVHAGALYVETLRHPIEVEGRLWNWKLEAPLAGLGIGKQLAWYGSAAR